MFRLATISPDTPEGSLHIVFQGDNLITDMRSPTPCLIPNDIVKMQGWDVERRQFLGYWHEQACFGLEIKVYMGISLSEFAAQGNRYGARGVE